MFHDNFAIILIVPTALDRPYCMVKNSVRRRRCAPLRPRGDLPSRRRRCWPAAASRFAVRAAAAATVALSLSTTPRPDRAASCPCGDGGSLAASPSLRSVFPAEARPRHAPSRPRGVLPLRLQCLARGVAIVARRPSRGGAAASPSPSLHPRPTARRPALATEAQLARVRVASRSPRGLMVLLRPHRPSTTSTYLLRTSHQL